MIDIDKFKLINDRYGHAAGDEVLERTGRLLREVVGESGFVFRYGGEEFAILIPDQDVERAAQLAWEIHGQFQSQKHVDLNITASLGFGLVFRFMLENFCPDSRRAGVIGCGPTP